MTKWNHLTLSVFLQTCKCENKLNFPILFPLVIFRTGQNFNVTEVSLHVSSNEPSRCAVTWRERMRVNTFLFDLFLRGGFHNAVVTALTKDVEMQSAHTMPRNRLALTARTIFRLSFSRVALSVLVVSPSCEVESMSMPSIPRVISKYARYLQSNISSRFTIEYFQFANLCNVSCVNNI